MRPIPAERRAEAEAERHAKAEAESKRAREAAERDRLAAQAMAKEEAIQHQPPKPLKKRRGARAKRRAEFGKPLIRRGNDPITACD